MGELLRQIWGRVTTTQQPPPWWVIALLGVLALATVMTPTGYRWVRQAVTVLHEAGHALTALLVGRRLSGIRLQWDTSGVTVSRGRARGPGMVATLAAGYPAPSLVALGATAGLGAGYAAALLWAMAVLTAVMVVFIRNLYGLVVLCVIGVTVVLVSWTAPAALLSALAYWLVWTMLFAAPRSVVELSLHRRRAAGSGRPDASSDAAQLARITGIPAVVWVGLFGVVTLACAVIGGAVLLG